MESILIKDTTREERERIISESIGNINGSWDGCEAILHGGDINKQEIIDLAACKKVWAAVKSLALMHKHVLQFFEVYAK